MVRLGTALAARNGYSRAERLSDAAVHVTGIVLALVAVPVLITLATVWRGETAAVVGTTIYGAALILMIGFSALYNMLGPHRWGGILRRLDHSAIYLKIAGTYTPFTLLSGQGSVLLAGLWAAAFAGVGLKAVSPDRLRWLTLGLYMAMGWAGLLAGGSFLSGLGPSVLTLIVIGGGLYTAGVAFYLWERLPFHYTIWHVFVLAASMVFYVAVTLQVAQGTTA